MSIEAKVFVEIDPDDIPPGPEGKSAYEVWLEDGHSGTESDFLEWLQTGYQSPSAGVHMVTQTLSPGAETTSPTFVALGLSASIEVPAGKKVSIDFRALVSHTQQRMVHFTLRRGVSGELHDSPNTGLGCIRVDFPDSFANLALQHVDNPGTGTHTYSVLWRQHHNDSPPGKAILGKRAVDTAIMVPATLTLMLVDA